MDCEGGTVVLIKCETGCQHQDRSEVVLSAEPAATRFDQSASANDARFQVSERFERRMRRQRRAATQRGAYGWRVTLW